MIISQGFDKTKKRYIGVILMLLNLSDYFSMSLAEYRYLFAIEWIEQVRSLAL